MKFIWLYLILFFGTQIYGQQQVADLVIPINVTLDDTAYHQLVEIGLDSTATDSLDFHLGEYNLPPIPPPGYVCFLILPYNNFSGGIVSFKDFRFGELPYTGAIEYRLRIMYNYGATISWNLPTGATGLLQDLFGGVIFNFPMNGNGSIYISDLDSIGGGWFRIFITYNNVIPIELTSFKGVLLDNLVRLDWTTATETNNAGFEILRFAQNDCGWEKVGLVPGFGTTTQPKSYSFGDENVTTGTYKYRLKQIDFDGSFTNSNEIEVEVEVDFTPKAFVLYQNYPNPFNPSTIIKFEIPNVGTRDRVSVRIIVYDVLGNEVATLVNEEKQPGAYDVELDASSLSTGMYLYKLHAGTFVQTKKMILAK
jgi:hypothetical protein